MTADIESVVGRAEQRLLEAQRERQQRRDDLDTARALVAELPDQVDRSRKAVERYEAKVHLQHSVYETLARAPRDIEELTTALAAAADQAPQPESADDLAGRAASLLDQLRLLEAEGAEKLRIRDELRGRLDAYNAKAHAIGLSENLELHNLYASAYDALYVAPCDVALAQRVVEAYEKAVHR